MTVKETKARKILEVRPLLYESYSAAIKNSLASNLFRNYYARVNGIRKDILENGRLSCAIFVSTILHNFYLISGIHATVDGTEKDLERSGWLKIKKPKRGSILIWELKKSGYGYHKHIGFFVGSQRAISNSSDKRFPTIHHWTYGVKNKQPVRKIESIYWNPKLENKN